jgi:hypothetical protein
MAIMPQIAMGFQMPQIQLPNQGNMLMQVAQLQQMQDANALRQAQARKLQLEEERGNALVQALRGGQPTLERLVEADPNRGFEVYKAFQEQQKAQEQQDEERRKKFVSAIYGSFEDPSLPSYGRSVRFLQQQKLTDPELDKFLGDLMFVDDATRKQQLSTLLNAIPGGGDYIRKIATGDVERGLKAAQLEKTLKEAGDVGKVKPSADMQAYGLAVQQGFKGSFLDYKTQLAQAGRSQVTVPVTVGGEAKPTPLQVKSDEAFSKDYIAWKQGGGVNTVKNTAQIGSVLQQLEEGKPLTGPLIGIQPDIVLAVTNPNAVDARQRVEQVAQESLRAILGAQFTQKEGEAFIARVYNPSLKPEKNASRLRALFKQLETAAAQKQAMVDYADEKGTVAGFKGKVPTIQDFYDAIDEKPSRSETTPPTVVRMPNGASYSFPDAEAAANFRKAAGLKD